MDTFDTPGNLIDNDVHDLDVDNIRKSDCAVENVSTTGNDCDSYKMTQGNKLRSDSKPILTKLRTNKCAEGHGQFMMNV